MKNLKWFVKNVVLTFCNSKSLKCHTYSQHKSIMCEMCGNVYPEVHFTEHLKSVHIVNHTPVYNHDQALQERLHVLQSDSSGNFTLAFSNTKNFKYPDVAEHFGQYGIEAPIIHKGHEEKKVLVSFKSKEAASSALANNFGSEIFPLLNIIPACRSNI